MKFIKGFSRLINEQYSIHISEGDSEEFKKILELNVIVHEEAVREYISKMYNEHPRKTEILWLYIKDLSNEKVVSSINISPQEWHFGNIILPICEMGFVGTLEEYRGSGLVKELNTLYEQIMVERGYLISVIRGIPYYYRSLGYEFAIPLDYRLLLNRSKIPKEALDHIKIRQVNSNELDIIREMYEGFYSNYFIWTGFNLEQFFFRFCNESYNDFQRKTFFIEENSNPKAFFTFGKSYDDLGYEVNGSNLTNQYCIKILQFIEEIHQEDSKTDEIDLAIREETDLADFIIKIGGHSYNTYGWQIKILELKKFFDKIQNVLETRLSNSEFRDISKNVKISNYKESIQLFIEKGRIVNLKIEKGYPKEGSCDLQIPDAMLYKLVLGDRTFEEINYIVKDALIKRESEPLIDVLFPREESYPLSYY